jgi:hypothetical protein
LDADQSSVANSHAYGGPLRSLSRLGRDLR